jgi:hypothetical protein
MANLEIASVRTGADDEATGSVETLVLGPKAAQTAESYVLSLFHLYPNVYLHKTTRGAEMMFVALMRRLLRLGLDGHEAQTGLPVNHPILRFARDAEIANLASGLRDRRLPTCIDIRRHVEEALPLRTGEARPTWQARITLVCSNIENTLKELASSSPDSPARILLDRYDRPPYKRYQDSNTPLNRILIRMGAGEPRDMAELSPVIAGAETFSISRAYVFRDDAEARSMVENTMRTEILGSSHGDA